MLLDGKDVGPLLFDGEEVGAIDGFGWELMAVGEFVSGLLGRFVRVGSLETNDGGIYSVGMSDGDVVGTISEGSNEGWTYSLGMGVGRDETTSSDGA